MTETRAPQYEQGAIAVIVVNYGTADLATAAVESVLAADHGDYRVEVHLVDNASPGDDAARLAERAEGWAGRVIFRPETENHGFARGNNVVLHDLDARPQPPEYVFLLNPDAEVRGDAIRHLAAFMDATPQAGAAGVRMLDGEGAPTTGAFLFPTIWSEFEKTVNFGPVTRALKSYRVPLPPDHPAGEVDWVSGAAVMFRFAALREVDFFDPGFFLYYEEVDLMRRLKQAGWQVHHRPEACVLHDEGASTQIVVQRRRPGYLYRSWRRYFSKSGRGYALLAALVLLLGSSAGLVIARILRRPPQVPQRFFRDHWHYVIAPLLGLSRDEEYEADSLRAKAAP